jgi:8-oxo-dGTP diphosphatase
MRTVEVVAGVLQHEGEILCARRGPSELAHLDRKWEFPGGKLEAGESHAAALARELWEELGIRVAVGERVGTVEHDYPDLRVVLHAFRCAFVPPCDRSHLQLREHMAFCWLPTAQLAQVDGEWAAADVPVLEALRDAGPPRGDQGFRDAAPSA